MAHEISPNTLSTGWYFLIIFICFDISAFTFYILININVEPIWLYFSRQHFINTLKLQVSSEMLSTRNLDDSQAWKATSNCKLLENGMDFGTENM